MGCIYIYSYPPLLGNRFVLPHGGCFGFDIPECFAFLFWPFNRSSPFKGSAPGMVIIWFPGIGIIDPCVLF